jgi:hypothetical protein
VKLALGVALVAAFAFGAAAVAAPARTSGTIACRDADRSAPSGGYSTGGRNLTIGALTIENYRRFADPATFARFRRGTVYRLRTTIFVEALSNATLAARGPSAVTFAYGGHAPAALVEFQPCRPSGMEPVMLAPTFWTGDIVVRKPGCYTFAARSGNDVFRKTIPLGTSRSC